MSLLKFFFTDKCSNCSQRIEKGANYCRHCGTGRAASWRKCNSCGSSVSADSAFCWNCNANLTAQPRDQIFSDRWRRTPGIFAARITIETPGERLRNGIQVDEGTVGGLYQNGALKMELEAGYHEFSGFWERLSGGVSGASMEALILVKDTVNCLISLPESAALHTQDSVPVQASLLVRARLEDLTLFTRQMMPSGTEIVRDDELMLPFTSRVAEVLRRYLSKLDVFQASRSTELRRELEAALGSELPDLMLEKGLRFCGVEDIRLDSEQITRVRESEGGLAQTQREIEWARKKREIENSGELGRLKDEFSFKEQLDRWTHEYTLTSMEREHIIASRRVQLQTQQKVAEVTGYGEVELAQQVIEMEKEKRARAAALAARHLELSADLEREAMQGRAEEDEMARLTRIQRERLKLAQQMKRENLELEQEFTDRTAAQRRQQEVHDIEIERQRVEIHKDAPAHVSAGALPADKARQMLSALEMLRPLPDVIILAAEVASPPQAQPSFMPQSPYPGQMPGHAPSYAPGFGPNDAPGGMPVPAPSFMPAGGPLPRQHSFTPFGFTRLEDVAQNYLPGVGVVVAGLETANPIPMGTAWLAAGRGVLVTNAHVAQAVAEAHEQAGMQISVIFSGQTQPYRVRRAQIHPQYLHGRELGHPIPSNDVAILELDALPPHSGLPLARRAKLLLLRPLQTVAYLGFPMENLAGGGTNLQRPQAVSKKGSINSLKDWTLAASPDPAQARLIEHDMGVAGGASGSPLFDESGEVIGIVSAGNMEHLIDPQTKRPRRFPSGVLLNFAQRLDVLLDWMKWETF